MGKELIMIALYVDDMLIASNSTKMLRKEKEALKKWFRMKDIGQANYCLGIEIHRYRANKKMLLHQTSHLTDLLNKYGMHDCKTPSTPQELGSQLFANEGDTVNK